MFDEAGLCLVNFKDLSGGGGAKLLLVDMVYVLGTVLSVFSERDERGMSVSPVAGPCCVIVRPVLL